MTEAFVYWPDIEGLHHVLRNLSRGSAPASRGQVGYKGKIKLHGCNGAITISADSTVRVQSRNRFIDEENKGLAKWAKDNAGYFASLWPRAQSYLRRDFGASATSLSVFGEWCGPGVQKGSEVAIGKLDKCIFAVFSLYIDNYLMIEPDDIKTLLGAYSLPDGMHVIPWGFDYMRLHLGDEQLLEGQLPKINAIVDEVDRFDPWVFQEFNIRGPGEGVVWYPVDLADRKVGSFKDVLSVELFSAYAFKTKGKTHQMVKKKDAGGNATTNEAVSIHVDVVDSEEELAELFLSEARYEQALQEVSSQSGDGRQHTTIEAIAQWMVKDVRKEAQAEFESASRPLRWEAVDRAVTKKVEQWAKSSENGPRVKSVMKELKANQASKYSSPSSSSSSSSSSSTSFKWFDQEDSSSSSSLSFSSSTASSSAPSDLFAGLVFSFSEHFAFKRKSELTDQIKRHGGTISYMLNDRCTHLVATPKEVADNLSGKIRQARKYVEEGKKPAARAGGDDVFHVIAGEWLDECLRQGVRVKEYPAFDLLAQLRLGASKAQDATEGEEDQTSVTTERKKIPQASVWSYGGKVEPYFPASNYDLLRMDVLHCMDIKDNHNKFYSMELHMSNEYVSPDNPGRCIYRILTHHGRTDDLDSAKTQIGQKETRYLQSLADAELLYDHVMAQKMADEKGYKHVDLVSVSPKIGSDKNAERNAASRQAEPERRDGASALPQEVQRLVKHLYDQASESVSKTVVAKITTRGIETPLGILSRKQIQRGEDVLAQLNDILAAEGADVDDEEKREARIVRLSQDFYSMIPHRLGTTKEEVHKAVISNLQFLEEKQDLLQLMKDIIETSNMRSRTSATSEIDRMYNALQCSIKPLDKSSAQYREIQAHFLRKKTSPPVVAQLHDAMTLEVANVFAIDKSAGGETAKALARRSAFASFSDDEPADDDAATANNKRLLFHASKVFNFVGLLSRGILPPKVVVSKGLSARTDFGYLGQGIYFSDNSYSSVKYTNLPATLPTTGPAPPKGGKRRGGKEQQALKKAEAANDDRFMLLVDVELGRMMDYRQITPHLTAPPQGFDSCHGVAATPSEPSDFVDDEYVIYDSAKQQLRYLVQFSPTHA